jgi:hypothetical protein
MNPQLSATAQDRIRNLAIPTRKNYLLTKHHNCLYSLFITPPGSLGERVRSRSERGGSCFLNAHHSDPDKCISQATYPLVSSTIHNLLYRDHPPCSHRRYMSLSNDKRLRLKQAKKCTLIVKNFTLLGEGMKNGYE